MKCFVLFLWISVIVLLEAGAAKVPQTDDVMLCKNCGSFSECPSTDASFRLSRTISCQDTTCIIGIVDDDDHSPCLLRRTSMNLQKLDGSMHIVSISNEPRPKPPASNPGAAGDDGTFHVVSVSNEPASLIEGANAPVAGIAEGLDAAESVAGATAEAGVEVVDAAEAGVGAAAETGAEAVDAAEAGAETAVETGGEAVDAAGDGAEAAAAVDMAGDGAQAAVEAGDEAVDAVGAGAEAAADAGAEAVNAAEAGAGAVVEAGAEAVNAVGAGAEAAVAAGAEAEEEPTEPEGDKPSSAEEAEPATENGGPAAAGGDGNEDAGVGAGPSVDPSSTDEAKPDPVADTPDYQGDEGKPEAGDGAVGAGEGTPMATGPGLEAGGGSNSTTGEGSAAPLTCFACSSASEANCTAKPTKQLDCRPSEGVRNACYTLVKGPRLMRGCLADLPPTALAKCLDPADDSCRLCGSSACNGDGWPRCVQCAGSGDCALAPNPQRDAQPCPLLRRDDARCFHYASAANRMVRGCTASSEAFARCQRAGADRCLVCAADDDACNATPLLKKPRLRCSRCDSRDLPGSDAALACAWAQPNESLVACTTPYPYYRQESCLAIHHPEMGWAVRGCSLDFGACEPTDRWCRACPTDGCNAGNLQWQLCLQCNSQTPGEAACGTDAAGLVATRCAAPVQPYERRGCYTHTNAETNTTTRGCISDLAEEGLRLCQTHNQTTGPCQLCYEPGCNNRPATSHAAALGQGVAAALGVLLVAVLYS